MFGKYKYLFVTLLVAVVMIEAVVLFQWQHETIRVVNSAFVFDASSPERVRPPETVRALQPMRTTGAATVQPKKFSEAELTEMACRSASGEWRCSSKPPAMK